MLAALKIDDEMRRRIWRGTDLLQMLEGYVIGRHSPGKVHHRLIDVLLWQLFQEGVQGDFQLISRLRLLLEFILLFQHGAPDVIV